MAKNPRILIGVGDLLGCGYYRCAVPYQNLAKFGFDVVLTNRLTYPSDDLKGIDAMVLQRQHNPQVYQIANAVQQIEGGKVIMELDDYFHDIPPNNPARASYLKGSQQVQFLEKFMELSDLMTVSTPGLKDNYSKFNSNIWVCPNKVEGDSFKVKAANPREGEEFRLGWAGSGTHHDDLLTIIKPVSELMYENPNIKLVFVGQFYKNLFPQNLHSRMEHVGHTFPMEGNKALFYSPDNVNPVLKYYDLLAKANLHAAIAPLLQVTFNRAKSYIKLIEYGICGIPFVATSFGPYSQYVNDAANWDHTKIVGLVADRNPEWKKQIKKYINDEDFRQRVALNNIENVKANHSIDIGVQNWLNALASIGIKPGDHEGSYQETIVKSV
jgi:glycosyltransferase involved in cell wall biosynthesis